MRAVWLVFGLSACAGLAAAPDGGGEDLTPPASQDAAPPPVSGPTRYPAAEAHSPMTAQVVAALRARLNVASGLHSDQFAKVGDSHTYDSRFLDCFAGSDVKLDSFSPLEDSRQHFMGAFARDSLAAANGWNAGTPLQGSPSPLQKEMTAIQPALAVVMFGTNDTYPTGVHAFERNLRALVDAILGLGAIPLISTIPPRTDDPMLAALVPDMNAVIRAVAQSRQIPYADLWQRLMPLPAQGLGGDGVHLNGYPSHPCWLTPDALKFGANQRNRITLEALDRVRRFLLVGETAEAEPPGRAGRGTWDDPYVVDSLPFVDEDDTTGGPSQAPVYSCATQDESGPERVYRIDLASARTLRARVFVDDPTDVDLHWLEAPSADRCSARADRTLEVRAGAGTHWLVADSFKHRPGRFRLTVVPID